MGMAAEPQFHVLAVDDSLIDRKLIERLLKRSSFQVTTVDSGSKALEFLGWRQPPLPSVSPDSQQVSFSPLQPTHTQKKKKVEVEVEVNLIITDYYMPEMTGYDLLKKVKESSSLRNIPVVIMSSEDVPSTITRCLDEGAEEFFIKPVRLSDVNRLKPHMLKAKYGQQQQQDMLEDCQKPEAKSSHLQQQQQQEAASEQQTEDQQLKQQAQEEAALEQQTEDQQLKQQAQEQQQQVLQQQQNNSKRKSLEDGLSTLDRTRPRCSGLTTVV